ncbi:Katanin p80 WD40 repeat-containing subunit B1 [Sesamum angolense]|uniref:Katanin p80 WD40 repeat-containing subunit B1 n=1 Tax=Sesamum angolense TaxID=2727404 RepID=A0AAE2BV81_9LAMI|nr:Katanin p80 WD40 repeat-containing subunit B1 [Sesamum angolense]
MAKRGYKLRILLIAWFCFYIFARVRCVPKVNAHVEEFVAHAGNVNCLSFGKKNCRVFITGGDDQKVNLWSVGKPTSLMSLCGHTSPVESAAFDSAEVLVGPELVKINFSSADKTVKFWDLETFEMIGSARREATGVRAITFHPDGRTLFCGLDDALKVYSWEPVICHDSVDMGWSTLGDLCIHDGKLLGGAYYENSVAVWVADVSLIEPYGTRLAPEQHNQSEQKCDTEQRLMEKEESHVKLKSNLRSTTPDSDSKEIKTIYVDRVNSVTSKTVEPVDVPKVVHPSDSKEISTVGIQKWSSDKLACKI